MMIGVHHLRPDLTSPAAKKCSLPYQTWEALNATVHGMYALAQKLFATGLQYFLPGKLCSDPIEVQNFFMCSIFSI
jgi:hypothetical protein